VRVTKFAATLTGEPSLNFAANATTSASTTRRAVEHSTSSSSLESRTVAGEGVPLAAQSVLLPFLDRESDAYSLDPRDSFEWAYGLRAEAAEFAASNETIPVRSGLKNRRG
jgi:hypothetical protein